MKSCANLEERADPPRQLGLSYGGRRNASQDFQQSALTRPVAADYAEHLALIHLERNIPQRPNRFWQTALYWVTQGAAKRDRRLEPGTEALRERASVPQLIDYEYFSEA